MIVGQQYPYLCQPTLPVPKRDTNLYSRAAFDGRVYPGGTFQERRAFPHGANPEVACRLAVAVEAAAIVLDVAGDLLRGHVQPDREMAAARVRDGVADGLAQDQVELSALMVGELPWVVPKTA